MKSNKKQLRRRKRKQRLWARNQTEPKFAGIFTRYLAVSLVSALLFSVAGTALGQIYYRQKCKAEFDAAYTRVIGAVDDIYSDVYEEDETVRDSQNDSKWQSFQAHLRYQFGLQSKCEAVLYHVDTGEVYVNSDAAMFLTVKGFSASELYVNQSEALEMAREAYRICEERYQGDVEDVIYRIDGYYLKDNIFVPGHMQIVKSGLDKDGAPKEILLCEGDFTPEDKENYIYIENKYADAVFGGDEKYRTIGPFVLKLEQNGDAKQKLSDLAEAVKNEEEWNTNPEYQKGTWYMRGAGSWMLGGSIDIAFCMVGRYNMFEDYGNIFYVGYAGIFLLAALLAYLLSNRVFQKEHARWQMDAYRRRMTDAMAHDLKSPLAAISVFAENLESNICTEKREYYARAILENVQYMNGLIEHILELAKTEDMGHVKARSEVELEPIIKDLLKQQEPVISERELQVTVSGSGRVFADKTQVIQIADNLISNAVKYTKQRGSISIRVQERALEISNDMEDALPVPAKELLQPFVKGDNSRSERQGTGIGLSIAKNLVEAQGGILTVAAEGSVFLARAEW